jgi:hypothetical protein
MKPMVEVLLSSLKSKLLMSSSVGDNSTGTHLASGTFYLQPLQPGRFSNITNMFNKLFLRVVPTEFLKIGTSHSCRNGIFQSKKPSGKSTAVISLVSNPENITCVLKDLYLLVFSRPMLFRGKHMKRRERKIGKNEEKTGQDKVKANNCQIVI